MAGTSVLPEDVVEATLVGRIHDDRAGGPCVIVVRHGLVHDVTDVWPTVAMLLEDADRDRIDAAIDGREPVLTLDRLEAMARLDGASSVPGRRLLAPIDLQVIKAAGVTFARSTIERVIEERAGGDPRRAAEIRERVGAAVGGAISAIVPGSPEAARAKAALVAEGLWSQYLEVGIGPDPEVFTKAPVLSAVGSGAPVGVLSSSEWNNPEPEVVLACRSDGTIVGATLGNDVNLRDLEGRSALLLGRAKDNNASCALGPLIRLLDDTFGPDDVSTLDVRLRIDGEDGFALDSVGSMTDISRPVTELVRHVVGAHHRYPDGFVLFTGTPFAPTQDRGEPDAGFTHRWDDVVRISNARLGTLENRVMPAEDAPAWTLGIRGFMENLAARGLLGGPARDGRSADVDARRPLSTPTIEEETPCTR